MRTIGNLLVHLIASFALIGGGYYLATAINAPSLAAGGTSAAQMTRVYSEATYYGVIAVALFTVAGVLEILIGFTRRIQPDTTESDALLKRIAMNTEHSAAYTLRLGKMLSGVPRQNTRTAPVARSTPPVQTSDFDDLLSS